MAKEKDIIYALDDQEIFLFQMTGILSGLYDLKRFTSASAMFTELSIQPKDKLPSLFLLDIFMPDEDGFAIAKKLQANEDYAKIPIIFSSGNYDAKVQKDGFEAGCVDFILKPCVPEIVKKRVANAILTYHLQEKLNEEVKIQTAKAEKRKKQLEKLLASLVDTLLFILSKKDGYTQGHCFRVAETACKIAAKMGYPESFISDLYISGILHDIGKVGIEDAILNKPGKLTSEEYHSVQDHTRIGYQILDGIESFEIPADVARHHHERYDGEGYPDHRKGEEIPIASRIIALADAYDVMTTGRSYQEKKSDEEIRDDILSKRGTQFDPNVVDVFMEILDHPEEYM